MAWNDTPIATSAVNSEASGTSIESDAFNVAVGDLLVVEWKCSTSDPADVVVNKAGGAPAADSVTVQATDRVVLAYFLIASADASFVVRVATSNSVNYRCLNVIQFRPDSGYTLSEDGAIVKAIGTSTAPSTTLASTSDNSVIIGSVKAAIANSSLSSPLIGGSAATDVWSSSPVISTCLHTFYRPSNAASSIAASATLSSSAAWVANVRSFKATGGAASGQPAAKRVGGIAFNAMGRKGVW